MPGIIVFSPRYLKMFSNLEYRLRRTWNNIYSPDNLIQYQFESLSDSKIYDYNKSLSCKHYFPNHHKRSPSKFPGYPFDRNLQNYRMMNVKKLTEYRIFYLGEAY